MAELTVLASLAHLGQVMDFVEEQLEDTGCGMKTLMQVQMAVEEIYVNIASYAYGSSQGMVTIRMEVEKEPGQVVITFSDRGIAYNPLEREDPNITLSAEERPVGGLGIFMAKKSMDSMKYEYQDGENVLIMRKIL